MVCSQTMSIHCIHKNNLNIRQEVWEISVDFTSLVALTKPEQPTAAKANTTLNKTQGKHAGATGNRQQQAPTHRKAETYKNQCLRTPCLHKAGTQHNSRLHIHVRRRVSDKSARHRSTHCSANGDWVFDWK